METLFRLLLGLVFLFVSAGAAVAQDLVAQGIEAMGGERALGELRTIAIRGQDIQWEYESSYEPGPKAQAAAKRRSKIHDPARSRRRQRAHRLGSSCGSHHPTAQLQIQRDHDWRDWLCERYRFREPHRERA